MLTKPPEPPPMAGYILKDELQGKIHTGENSGQTGIMLFRTQSEASEFYSEHRMDLGPSSIHAVLLTQALKESKSSGHKGVLIMRRNGQPEFISEP